jgi:hypothetical protein
MFRYLKALSYDEAPNYECLKKLFWDELKTIEQKSVLACNGFNRWKCREKFDWLEEN